MHDDHDTDHSQTDLTTNPKDNTNNGDIDIETYDPSYYETQLVRAVESVLSPLGWDRTDIRRELAETQEMDLMEYIRAK